MTFVTSRLSSSIKMNEEIDDNDFYHQDFTTASQWEIFIARMEEIINQWKTDDSETVTSKEKSEPWHIRSEKLPFADVEFCLFLITKHVDNPEGADDNEEAEKQKEVPPMDPKHDFELFDESLDFEHSCLHTWYGVNDYIVLAPCNNVDIISESKIKVLVSSAYVVANNLKCGRPIFVQVREKWQKFYMGVYENEEIRINFEMVHLKHLSSYYKYLTGLLDLFKKKIMSPVDLDNNIYISLQHTYALQDFGRYSWKQDLMSGENFDIESVFILPFGVTIDPVSTLLLKTTWYRMPNFSVMEYEYLTYFHAVAAHEWSFMVKMTNEPLCLLGDALTEFHQILNNNSTIHDILGDFATLPAVESNPLDVLTEPAVPTISALLTRAARRSLSKNKRSNPPIAETVLVPLLYFLFPDADENSSFPYGVKEDNDVADVNPPHEMFQNLEEEFKSFKTCGNDSLIWRLSIVLAHSLQSLGGVRAFIHIWYEFVQEMRYRWDKSMPIPGLAPGFPDLRTCLLNQKLQMLNSCIDRKLSRETKHESSYDSAEGSSTDDEEFFDCSEKPAEENKKKVKHSLWNQPVGRLSKFGDMKLLKTGDPLYIPVTQNPVLKTEDQLEEDTDVLLKLGSDAEATELRARIMSASLLSDMESFKAANPGSIVEDFIRWYSPRDWIEEEEESDEWGQKKGHLSPRMMIEDNNIWVQMWKSAKPVPASRQKRLFDDTREAEKVLQFLELRTVSQIAELIIPVLAHAAIYRLVDECRPITLELSQSAVNLPTLLRQGTRLSRDTKLQPKLFESFIHEVSTLELLVSQINSLSYKLNPSGTANGGVGDTVAHLVAGREVRIEGQKESPLGGRVLDMFLDAGVVVKGSPEDNTLGEVSYAFPPATQRDFVLKTMAVRPAVYSAECPQFLRAISSSNECRMAGAFSEDIVFF